MISRVYDLCFFHQKISYLCFDTVLGHVQVLLNKHKQELKIQQKGLRKYMTLHGSDMTN